MKKVVKVEAPYQNISHIKDLSSITKLTSILNSIQKNYIDSNNNITPLTKLQFFNSKLPKDIELFIDAATEKLILGFMKDGTNKEFFYNYINEHIKELQVYYSSGIDSTGEFYRKTDEQNIATRVKLEKVIGVAKILLKNNFFVHEEINTIKNSFKEVNDFIENRTNESYKIKSFEKIGKHKIDSFINFLGQTQQNLLSNKKEILLKQLKSYNLTKVPLQEEVRNLIVQEKYSMEDLPVDSRTKVDNITKLVGILKNKEVDEFVQERLPMILKKYFSISEEYRASLTNVEGFNAHELMLQSLENIERIIIAKKEDNNVDLITELSIENRKLKVKRI